MSYPEAMTGRRAACPVCAMTLARDGEVVERDLGFCRCDLNRLPTFTDIGGGRFRCKITGPLDAENCATSRRGGAA